MEPNVEIASYLIVNRVEVLHHAGCSACGREFTTNPMGEKALVLPLHNAERTYFFCGTCGDNIVGRVEAEEARKRYIWDWAIPLRTNSRAAA
jgi:predicted RNA-binding Zn-ribbon protein involved in translation (DUF1610 family)